MNQLHRAYAILGLVPGASPSVVRRAYRELVRAWHPDRFTDNPDMQLVAQEKLKQINESYRLIQDELSVPPSRPCPPVKAPPPAPASAHPPAGTRSSSTAATTAPKPAHTLTTFLAYWPNLLFLLFAVASLRVAFLRYGASPAGLAYLVQMTLLPVAFATACNSRLGEKRSLWVAYVLAVVILGAFVGLDALNYRKELHEAGGNRYPAAVDGGGGALSGDGFPMPGPREPFAEPERRAPTGPSAPAVPQVPVPAAPTPPDSPVVPHGR